jgi:hypothetical protein
VAELVDRAIARLAAGQGGHVTRVQLLGVGLTRRQIEHRARVGRLIPVHRGVYAVGCLPAHPENQAAAALLACGGKAVLSHSSGTALYGAEPWTRPFEVTTRGDRRPSGIRVHTSKLITREDIRRHKGLWVTTPEWTVLDMAPCRPARRLVRLVNELHFADDVNLRFDELRALVARLPNHPGAKPLRALLDDDTGPTRSELERILKRFLQHFGFTGYVLNQPFPPYTADALFVRERVIVEADSWKFHKTREAFERDRLRDAWFLAEHDIVTVRITHRRLTELGAAEARALRQILARRRS